MPRWITITAIILIVFLVLGLSIAGYTVDTMVKVFYFILFLLFFIALITLFLKKRRQK